MGRDGALVGRGARCLYWPFVGLRPVTDTEARMKKDLLINIRWIAHSWGAWVRIANSSPLHGQYRGMVNITFKDLMIACAEFNIWYSHERMRTR